MIEVYTQFPGIPSEEFYDSTYLDVLNSTVENIEENNINGALIFYNHEVVDPLVLASYVLNKSKTNTSSCDTAIFNLTIYFS